MVDTSALSLFALVLAYCNCQFLYNAQSIDAGQWLAAELGLSDTGRAAQAIMRLRGQEIKDLKQSIDPDLLEKRTFIEHELASGKLTEAIAHSENLIKEVVEKYSKYMSNELVAFIQSIYAIKINAEIKDRQFVKALYDKTKFQSFCAGLNGAVGCYQIYLIDQLTKQTQVWFDHIASPAQKLGFDTNKPIEQGELKKALRNARLLLHPDKNMNLTQDSKDYLRSLFSKINEAYETLMKNTRVNNETSDWVKF